MRAPVVLVGLGAIGQGYDTDTDSRFVRSHARALSTHPRFRLVAGVDIDARLHQAFTQATGAPAFSQLEEALGLHSPELVVIATPTPTHADVLHRVLANAAPAIVLCEKPLAPHPIEARAMVDACKSAGVELFVNYFRRSLPGAVEVRRRLDAGLIAPPCKVVAWYSKGFLHNGSHFFNLLEYWLGPAMEYRAIGPARAGPAGLEIDCQVRFERGEGILLSAWEESYSHFALELLSRTGRLEFHTQGSLAWQSVVPIPLMPGYHCLSESVESIESGMDRYQWHVVDQLARRLDGRPAELCEARVALRMLEVMVTTLEASGKA